MERWIIRSVALLCAAGGLGLFWAFGAFAAIPLRDGRIFDLNTAEMQVIGVSLVAGLLVAWGAVHLLSLSDKEGAPRAYRTFRLVYAAVIVSVMITGAVWSTGRVLAA